MQIQLPRVGDVVDGKYQLDENIGEGGFAVVFRATDLAVGRAVALKVLKPGESGYAVTVASRFAREARSLAGLGDAHTLRLFDFGRTPDGVLYMVSELLGGQDLRDLLDERDLTEPEVVHIMRQLLSSLREAHQAGILHRDIKPSNVQVFEYLGDPLRVKLIDFGIARPTGPDAAKITQTGAVIGTPRYMSPEQAIGEPLTASSDLFSLGLVALEMLTGDPRAPLDALLEGRPLDLPISPKLRGVLERMLQRNVARRFTNAEDVLAALDGSASSDVLQHPAWSSSAGTPVRRDVPVSNASRPMSQAPTRERVMSPRMMSVAAIAIMVVVFGLGVVAIAQRDKPDDERTLPAEQRPVSALLTSADTTTSGDVTAPTAALDLGTAPTLAADADMGAGSKTGCGTAHKPGLQDGSHSEGWARIDWKAWVPRGYDPDTPAPLVMLIHGSDGEARDLLIDGGGFKVADREGFLVVAPQGSDTWSFADEEANTFRVIVRRMLETYCIDRDRIFVLGHDTGAIAAERLTCEPWVRAVGSTSWRPRRESTPCSTPKPRIIFSPMQSLHLPLEAGTQCVGQQVFGVETFEAIWQKRNRCKPEPERVLRKGKTACWRWDCEAPLTSCHVDGGHNWRGMSRRRFDLLNCDGVPAKFDYTATAWNFFDSLEEP